MHRLVCFDMDGVLLKTSNSWLELHKRFGTEKEGCGLTARYLHNDYPRLVEEVVYKLWKGKDAAPFFALVEELPLMDGAQELVDAARERGYFTAIITSGPEQLAERVKRELGIDEAFANRLVIRGNQIEGFEAVVGRDRKQEILKRLCEKHHTDLKDAVVVVHDENDVKLARVAGIAVCVKPVSGLRPYCSVVVADVREAAEHLP